MIRIASARGVDSLHPRGPSWLVFVLGVANAAKRRW